MKEKFGSHFFLLCCLGRRDTETKKATAANKITYKHDQIHVYTFHEATFSCKLGVTSIP